MQVEALAELLSPNLRRGEADTVEGSLIDGYLATTKLHHHGRDHSAPIFLVEEDFSHGGMAHCCSRFHSAGFDGYDLRRKLCRGSWGSQLGAWEDPDRRYYLCGEPLVRQSLRPL